uniref:Uncharacterized protein n=1 Tax=Meloidogyne enterolobii TaxID=390850 RepID=A0A6V7W6F3_MELEN|nr:unnamed protein product [Meloidogyne enterolobii]
MAGLALNRFHAVFFVFSYQHLWKLKNIKYYILAIWIITILYTSVEYALSYMGIYNGILGFVERAIIGVSLYFKFILIIIIITYCVHFASYCICIMLIALCKIIFAFFFEIASCVHPYFG